MATASHDPALDAVLLPNGDVRTERDPGYYLGSILHSGQFPEGQPLLVEIDVGNLGRPAVAILDTFGWRVRVLGGQGSEPIHGRVNGIELRVVRPG